MYYYKLSEIAEVFSGQSIRGAIDKNTNGLYKIVTSKAISEDRELKLFRCPTIDLSSESSKPKLILRGDILFVLKFHKTSTPYSVLMNATCKNLVCSPSFLVIRVNHEIVLPEYLDWWLNSSEQMTKFYRANTKGNGRTAFITKRALIGAKVPVASIGKQKGILNQLWQAKQSLSEETQRFQDKLKELERVAETM
jgi:hypothetical protein